METAVEGGGVVSIARLPSPRYATPATMSFHYPPNSIWDVSIYTVNPIATPLCLSISS